MASVNMASILTKAKRYASSSETQKEIREYVNKIMLGDVSLQFGASSSFHTAEDVANKFIDVLRWEICASGLSENAIASLSGLDYTSPARVGDTNSYLIRVFWAEDLSRPSLQEAKYGSIKDLAELFNYGVDHRMHAVFGTWEKHGKEVWSRTTIPGAHFMEQAVKDFLGNYGSEYNVVEITIV